MKPVSTILILTGLLLLLCNPVSAQHNGPYAGGFLGGGILLDAKGSDSQGDFALNFKPAMSGSAVLGWDFATGNPIGEGRIELEYSRRSNQLERARFAEGSFKGNGDLTADCLLVNFFGVLRDIGPWAPYAGVGIGAARIEASGLQVEGQPLGNGTDTVFAYQLGVGLDVTMTKYLSLDLGYRFFGSTSPKFNEAGGGKFAVDYMSHNAVLGVRVGF